MLVRRAFAVLASLAVAALCAPVGASAAAAQQVVAGSRIAAVADKVAERLVSGPDRALFPAYRVDDQHLPAGDVEIAPSGTPFVTATYVGVPVAITVDGKLARTLVAGYRVATYITTAVAGRDLAPGAVLAPEDVVTSRVLSNGRPAVGTDVLMGRRLSSATPKGAPLYVEQTIPNAVVKAGQAAILVIHDGTVALCADVVARTGGAVGDTVTVVNPSTQKAIAAVVTAPNRVELTLPGGDR